MVKLDFRQTGCLGVLEKFVCVAAEGKYSEAEAKPNKFVISSCEDELITSLMIKTDNGRWKVQDPLPTPYSLLPTHPTYQTQLEQPFGNQLLR